MSAPLPLLMLAALGAALFTGLPVGVVLIGVAFGFAAIGIGTGALRVEDLGAVFHRVYGTLSDSDEITYAAVPLLLFMGAVMHESGLAADLLGAAQRFFRGQRAGPALATIAVGAIQAPAAGMIGASTGALALAALPALRRGGHDARSASGLVAAAGTLGAVAPPGIMLFFVADAMGAQVPALFLAMLGPLALLLSLYVAHAVVTGPASVTGPQEASAGPPDSGGALAVAGLMVALVALVASGRATLSEAAALAALGALAAAAALRRLTLGSLGAAIRRTALMGAMVFFIYVGASVFALVFRLLGGQQMIAGASAALGGGGPLALGAALLLVVVLGFFLDWLEIVVIALPLLGPALVSGGAGAALGNEQLVLCWLAALFALSLQTSFLTPPFGYALFLVHGASSGSVGMMDIWRGAIPYLVLQMAVLVAVVALPELATWLPAQLLDLSIPKGPRFSE